MTTTVQVLGISNAIVDILAHVDEQTLEKIGSPKGSMTLVDADRAIEIYSLMGPTTEMSGGSVANTIANLAVLGGQTAYIGRVADDAELRGHLTGEQIARLPELFDGGTIVQCGGGLDRLVPRDPRQTGGD